MVELSEVREKCFFPEEETQRERHSSPAHALAQMGERISQKFEQIMLFVKHVAHILEIVETNPDFFLYFIFLLVTKQSETCLLRGQRAAPEKKVKMLIIYTLRTGKLNYSNGNSRFLILLWFSFSISHDFQRRLQYKNIGTQ